MTQRMRALLLSNGHGEDELGALLARELMEANPRLEVSPFPLVGEGGAYHRAGLPIIGEQQSMPSGGFIFKNSTNLIHDVRAGLLGLVRRQWTYLRKHREEYDWVIALGDVLCLVLGGMAVRRPLVFVPTAKSEYISGHYRFEYNLMKRYARKVFPRDQQTADALVAGGVPAQFVGNLMMDALDLTERTFGLPSSVTAVAFLPGSRADAYVNCDDLFQVARALPKQVVILLSIVPSLQIDEVSRVASEHGWLVRDAGGTDPDEVAVRYELEGRTILGVQGHFGSLLARAKVVVGLAGTGNEQAAGLGRPVVTFPGRGTQFTRRFALAQKRLLGEAVSLMPREHETIAREVIRILEDPETYQKMARVGKERLGPPGAAKRMAQQILTVMG